MEPIARIFIVVVVVVVALLFAGANTSSRSKPGGLKKWSAVRVRRGDTSVRV